MDALFDMIKSIEYHGSITMPIVSMHKLPVNVSIERKKYTQMKDGAEVSEIYYYFEISDSYYRTENDSYHYYFKTFDRSQTDEQIKLMLEKIVLFIKTCKIDKLTGMFRTEGDEMMSMCDKNIHNFSRLIDLFEDVEHIKTVLNRCCVCHDWTHTTLKDCSHSVCIDCLSQLEMKTCEDCCGDDPYCNCDKCRGLERVKACPMCRNYIIEGIE